MSLRIVTYRYTSLHLGIHRRHRRRPESIASQLSWRALGVGVGVGVHLRSLHLLVDDGHLCLDFVVAALRRLPRGVVVARWHAGFDIRNQLLQRKGRNETKRETQSNHRLHLGFDALTPIAKSYIRNKPGSRPSSCQQRQRASCILTRRNDM
jgi:hypothetical protein